MPIRNNMLGFILMLTVNSIASCNNVSTGKEVSDTASIVKSAAAPAKPAAVDPLAHWQPLVYDSTKKYIYLTFDDGPNTVR